MKKKRAMIIAEAFSSVTSIDLTVAQVRLIAGMISELVREDSAVDDEPVTSSFGGIPVAVGSRHIGGETISFTGGPLEPAPVGCAIQLYGHDCKDHPASGVVSASQAAARARKEIGEAFSAAGHRVQLGFKVAEIDTTAQQVESLYGHTPGCDRVDCDCPGPTLESGTCNFLLDCQCAKCQRKRLPSLEARKEFDRQRAEVQRSREASKKDDNIHDWQCSCEDCVLRDRRNYQDGLAKITGDGEQ